jgi:hypothetical protein
MTSATASSVLAPLPVADARVANPWIRKCPQRVGKSADATCFTFEELTINYSPWFPAIAPGHRRFGAADILMMKRADRLVCAGKMRLSRHPHRRNRMMAGKIMKSKTTLCKGL